MDDDDKTTKKVGTVKRVLGFATGDRGVEAEGKVEERTGHEPDAAERKREEDRVRAEHGDIDPALR